MDNLEQFSAEERAAMTSTIRRIAAYHAKRAKRPSLGGLLPGVQSLEWVVKRFRQAVKRWETTTRPKVDLTSPTAENYDLGDPGL